MIRVNVIMNINSLRGLHEEYNAVREEEYAFLK